MRDGLKFRTDRQYSTIAGLGNWDWDLADQGGEANYYKNVAPYLGRAMRENSGLRVFVGQGYFDFATPFFGAEYSLSRTGIPQDRIVYAYYGSGPHDVRPRRGPGEAFARHKGVHPGEVRHVVLPAKAGIPGGGRLGVLHPPGSRPSPGRRKAGMAYGQ